MSPVLPPGIIRIECMVDANIHKKSFRHMDIMDNMVSLLEKYASNLEDIVANRTQQLTEEKKKTDMLLYQMLPPWVIAIFLQNI